MPSRAGSPTPFLIGFLVIAVLALAGNWRIDMMRRDGRAAASAINTNLVLAEEGIDQLRGAQAAYVGPAQKADEWMNQATALTVQLDSAVANLAATTTSSEARPHYEAAAKLVSDITANDKKARALVASGDTQSASNVVFQEGSDPSKKLSVELAAARDAEMAAFEKSAASLGTITLAANGGAFALAFVLFALATRTAKDTAPSASESTDGALHLHNVSALPPPVPQHLPVLDTANSLFAAPSDDIAKAAELCVDLGRIIDGRDLPALMGRAAEVLEAKGIVLWVSESGGTVLRPTVAHGYPDRVLQRMGTLPTDGDNVTSLAYRTLQPQVLRSSIEGHGAIAVPLITAGGCVGVLAAEVQGAKPGDVRFALARMIAAQLSTLIGPSAAPNS